MKLKTAAIVCLTAFVSAASPLLSAIGAELASPSQTYLSYHRALMGAHDVNDIIAYMDTARAGSMSRTPPSMRPLLFKMLRQVTPENIKVASEKIEGDQATLQISTADRPAGTATLVLESSGWKVSKEVWNTSVGAK